jgi:hypothetical protein
VQLLARLEGEVEREAPEACLDALQGDEAHLDAREPRVVERPVGEGGRVEVAAELAVEDEEHVLVELRGDPARVVVGGVQARVRLDEVDAEQEAVLALQHGAHAEQEGHALGRLEVADGRAEEAHEARAGARDAAEVALEVADDSQDLEPGVARAQALSGGVERRGGDVDRHEALAAVSPEGVEQELGLPREAAPISTISRGRTRATSSSATRRGSRSRRVRQYSGRRVISSNSSEPRVVEVLGRQLLRAARQPGARVGLERP